MTDAAALSPGECLDDRIPGAINLRHLGGYPAGNGRLQTGRLYRSGSLSFLDRDGVRALGELGIRTVIDLRSRGELARDGVPDLAGSGIRYRHIRVVGASELGPDARRAFMHEIANGERSWADHYIRILRESATSLAEAAALLSETGTLPALIHCSAGRDRTGVLVALLLALAGVPDEVIAEDYAVSGRHLLRHAARFEAIRQGYGMTRVQFDAHLESSPSSAIDFLERMRAEFGSAENCFLLAGATPAVLSSLQATLLAPTDEMLDVLNRNGEILR